MLGEYNVPSGTVSISARAFSGCSVLSRVDIPSSVMYIREEVFDGCSSLQYIQVSKDNRVYSSDNGVLCSNTAVIRCPE